MLSELMKKKNWESRSICAENFTGEKGKAGMATEGTGTNASRDLGQGWKVSPSIKIPAGETFTLAQIEGPAIIKHIWVTEASKKKRSLILRMYWDDSDTPSVECPLGDFFACPDPDNYAQLTSLPICVNPRRAFNCYWDMPFRKNCRITLENISEEELITVYYQIDYVLTDVPEDALYFHAQFRRVNPLPYKEVYTILDNVKGNGHYVGTYMYWGVNNNGWWGEGEIKFYLDGDKKFPTICGTGTEDYFCGSWNFDVDSKYVPFTTPYSGLAKVSHTDETYHSNRRFSMYRWHITDPVCFKEDIKVTIQALGWRSGGRYLPLQDDISSVAYWYSDTLEDEYPTLPDRDGLEIV